MMLSPWASRCASSACASATGPTGNQSPLIEQERKTFLDEANSRFGAFAVTYANVISPAWRSDGIRRVDVK
jgi:hypothetical protein